MFDVSNLSARDQFEAAVAVSGMCLVAAVMLREWFTDRDIRVIARVLGIAGYAVVVTFAWRMTETNETLATQLMVREKADATSIANQSEIVVAERVIEVATKSGLQVSWTEVGGRRDGPVPTAGGCTGRSGNTVGVSIFHAARTNGSIDAMSNAKSVTF